MAHLGIELMLKSVILHGVGDFPATHDLKALVREVQGSGLDLLLSEQMRDTIDLLNSFGGLRYPSPKGMPTIAQSYWDDVFLLRRALLERMGPRLERVYSQLDDTNKGGRKLLRPEDD
jgi:hypothetical protein